MDKEFVGYTEALALKELGFEEPCFGFYNDMVNNKPMGGNFPCDGRNSAPLYQQAFRWLLVLANKDEHFSNKWTISYNEDYYSLFLGGCNMGVFKAELECIKKLIEIVKESINIPEVDETADGSRI
jgi:hypothetical protein